MKNIIIKISLVVIILLLAGFFLGIPYLDNSEIDEKVSLLKKNINKNDVAKSFKLTEFAQLPQIVKSYLQKSIKKKSVSPTVSKINIVGKTKSQPNSKWIETKSTIYYSITEPAFIEVAEISSPYPLWTKIVDTYINNIASTNRKLISSIPSYEFSGNKLNRSYIVLYLMESVFSPTALLPNMNVHWKKNDNSSAMATAWNDQLKGSALFYFNSENEVTKIVSANRYMPGKLDYTKETFTVYLANYKDVGDYYIPTYFEFQWNLAAGDFTFGRFQITDIEYK